MRSIPVSTIPWTRRMLLKSDLLIATIGLCLLASGCSSALSSSVKITSRMSAGLAAQAKGDYAAARCRLSLGARVAAWQLRRMV